MELSIKQLKQQNKIIAPQTIAEAVLVKHNDTIQRLDTILSVKKEQVITPAGSGVKAIDNGTSVILTHSNEITPIEKAMPLSVKYDNRGHIIEAKPLGKLSIVVNNELHIEHDGSQDQLLQMGDDFTLDENNKIKLNWNEF